MQHVGDIEASQAAETTIAALPFGDLLVANKISQEACKDCSHHKVPIGTADVHACGEGVVLTFEEDSQNHSHESTKPSLQPIEELRSDYREDWPCKGSL